MIAFILSLDSSFVISGSTFDSKKTYVVVSCVLHHAFFFDSSSSDNTVCLRRSASKAKCIVNGAIIRAHRKRVRLGSRRVKNGVHPTRPDPTRPDPTRPDPTQHSLIESLHRCYRAVYLSSAFYKMKTWKRLVKTIATKYELLKEIC